MTQTKTILQKQQPHRFFIKVTGGPQGGKIYNLVGESVRIGRGPANDIIIDDPNLSRNHAIFIVTGSRCVVKDLKSRNGIYVNSKRVAESELKHQDFIQLGDTEAVFIEADKDIDLRPAAHATDNSQSAKPSFDIKINDGNASNGGMLNMSDKAGSLFERLLGQNPKTRRLRLIGICCAFVFLMFFLMPKSKNLNKTAAPQSRASQSSTAAESPEEAPPTSDTQPSAGQNARFGFAGTPGQIYAQCLDLEDLGLFRKAAECYVTIPNYTGARDGYERVLHIQDELAKELYVAGQDLFEIGSYGRALEKWTRVVEVARQDSEYYKLAIKGINKINKLSEHDSTHY